MDDFVTELLNIPDTNVLSYKITAKNVYIYIESAKQRFLADNVAEKRNQKV